MLKPMVATGLVKGEGFAVDASVIEADASRFQRVEGSEIDWTKARLASRPVREYLRAPMAQEEGIRDQGEWFGVAWHQVSSA